MCVRVPAFAMLWLFVGACTALATETVTIEARGDASAESLATSLVLEVDVYCEASTLKEALELLDEQRRVAGEAAVKLGAIPDAVAFELPQVVAIEAPSPSLGLIPEFADSLNDAPMSAETNALELPAEVEPVDHAGPMPIMVSARLTAHFPLESKTANELLAESSQLQREIRTADLSGLVTIKEAREKAAAAGNSDAAQPCLCGLGRPRFRIAADLTAAERQRLLSVAVAAARQDALALATAAGAEVRNMKSLSIVASRNPHSATPDHATSAAANTLDAESEATSCRIVHRVIVAASFEALIDGQEPRIAATR